VGEMLGYEPKFILAYKK
jgi:DNA mismatch repair ATPase MutS